MKSTTAIKLIKEELKQLGYDLRSLGFATNNSDIRSVGHQLTSVGMSLDVQNVFEASEILNKKQVKQMINEIFG